MNLILFRADANPIIGSGHVMRCLSIAGAYKKHCHEVLFITADHNADSLIERFGFDHICLETRWDDMACDIGKVEDIINSKNPSLMIVDSYYVNQSYFDALSRITKIVYMDDLNESTWNVDAIINYNIYATSLDYSNYEGTRTKLILGPKYAPLREEFRRIPAKQIKDVTDIFVSAGGSDPECITIKLIKDICPIFENIKFHFVVGSLNPRIEEIKELSLNQPNAILHINENNMSGLMQKCDLAISASGSTLYELCACGVPTITYSLADNQLLAMNQFEQQGLMKCAGDCRHNDGFTNKIKEILELLISNSDQRRNMSSKMQKLVDGLGVEHIFDALNGL